MFQNLKHQWTIFFNLIYSCGNQPVIENSIEMEEKSQGKHALNHSLHLKKIGLELPWVFKFFFFKNI